MTPFTLFCRFHSNCYCLRNLASSSSGPDNLENLKRLAEHFQKQVPGAEASASAAAQDEDDVPELVPGETFEEAAEVKEVPEAEPEEKKDS